jgi:hypothetical protein
VDEGRERVLLIDKVLNYLLEQLFDRDPDLSANRKMTRALVYYMYWNCDIGLNHAAATDQTQ